MKAHIPVQVLQKIAIETVDITYRKKLHDFELKMRHINNDNLTAEIQRSILSIQKQLNDVVKNLEKLSKGTTEVKEESSEVTVPAYKVYENKRFLYYDAKGDLVHNEAADKKYIEQSLFNIFTS